VTTFHDVWDPVKSGFQVGFVTGASIGQGGNAVEDVVNIWLGDPLGPGLIIDSEAYGMTEGFSGRSWDVALQAFSTVGNGSGAVATLALGGTNNNEPAIGSPGMSVPEPNCILLALVSGAAVPLIRRRRPMVGPGLRHSVSQ
jgi:hypothetical protein